MHTYLHPTMTLIIHPATFISSTCSPAALHSVVSYKTNDAIQIGVGLGAGAVVEVGVSASTSIGLRCRPRLNYDSGVEVMVYRYGCGYDYGRLQLWLPQW